MEDKKIEKEKDYKLNEPKKVIAFLKCLSKEDNLCKIREEIKKKYKINEDYFFVDKENDKFEKGIENISTLEDIFIDNKGFLKIFLSPKDKKPDEPNNKIENIIKNNEMKESNNGRNINTQG